MKLSSRFIAVLSATAILLAGGCAAQPPRIAAGRSLAATPPMGWNDWAHYQCGYSAASILGNARALVRTGLAARGYDTVTIDDCWMLAKRDRRGNLQPDPQRFPQGMRPVAAAIHTLGLRFGIYEDAGSLTCGGFAGSGAPAGGGEAHFAADARLFATWGVDYLKLDGCNVTVARGQTRDSAYRAAYGAERRALDRAGRPVVFSESAPAYFQGTRGWYDVLRWARGYGQLWREGTDVEVYDPAHPGRSRFASVMWSYAYNLQLGRFQGPGNWNDADFIIGGDQGMTLAETRSQLALWSMMSAPLILSSDLETVPPAAIAILANRRVLSVDQDPWGRMAALIRRDASMDLLLKPLHDGSYAVAALNRGGTPLRLHVLPGELGFPAADCRLDVRELWSGARQVSAAALRARIESHDTEIWKIRPESCGIPARVGLITRILPQVARSRRDAQDYTRCLAAPGSVEPCAGARAQSWQVTAKGELRSGRECLGDIKGRPRISPCSSYLDQRWRYTPMGNLVNRASRLCLSGSAAGPLALRACGHNLASQIWTLPNGVNAP